MSRTVRLTKLAREFIGKRYAMEKLASFFPIVSASFDEAGRLITQANVRDIAFIGLKERVVTLREKTFYPDGSGLFTFYLRGKGIGASQAKLNGWGCVRHNKRQSNYPIEEYRAHLEKHSEK